MFFVVHPKTPHTMIQRVKGLGHHVSFSLSLSSDILSHPDQQLHLLDKNIAITAPEFYSYYRNILPDSITLLMGEKSLMGTYPMDCAYNVARMKHYIFCNPKSVDTKLIQYYKNAGYTIVSVKQGYAKCNLAILNDFCAFTEDHGIYETVKKSKLDIVLHHVPVGEISLADYPYGFIGGCCGGGEGQLFWYGNPACLSYYDKIKQETERAGISNIALGELPPEDLGGIICFSM